MHTTRTTILSDDEESAKREFDHWVHHEAVVLLVILGTGLAVESIVEDADKMAEKLSKLAHVLWARNPAFLKDKVTELEAKPSVLKKLQPGTPQGFALSLTDKVVDVLTREESPPDLTRLFELFNNALDDAGALP